MARQKRQKKKGDDVVTVMAISHKNLGNPADPTNGQRHQNPVRLQPSENSGSCAIAALGPPPLYPDLPDDEENNVVSFEEDEDELTWAPKDGLLSPAALARVPPLQLLSITAYNRKTVEALAGLVEEGKASPEWLSLIRESDIRRGFMSNRTPGETARAFITGTLFRR